MKKFSEWINENDATIIADEDILVQTAGSEANVYTDNVTGETTKKNSVVKNMDIAVTEPNVVAEDFLSTIDLKTATDSVNAPFAPKSSTIPNDDFVNDIDNYM